MILSRVFGANQKVTRARRADRSPLRRRARFTLETLEDRDLKSNIPGVQDVYGGIMIKATQADHNVASVSIDPANQNVKVTLNGDSVEFDSGEIWTLSYTGSRGGWDSFTNDTSIPDVVSMQGGNNTMLGGSSWNYVNLYGDNNTFDARGGASDVFTFAGPNDHLTLPGIELQFGGIMLNATQADHNTASVSIDHANGNILASLNGSLIEADPSLVWSISYTGSYGGGDTFANYTDIPDVVYTFGGNNTVVGGSSWNYVLMFGTNDTYDAPGSSGEVFTFGSGSSDNINTSDSSTVVYAYAWNPYDS